MSNCLNGNLVSELDIGAGKDGKSLEFVWRGTELGVRVEGQEEYQFVDLEIDSSNISIELQIYNGYIQWKRTYEIEWKNLIAISELKGDNGKSLEFMWQGTELGVRQEGSVEFKYVDLKGKNGSDGANGKSAYELWLESGNEGTIDDFLLSLKGKDGEKGEQGPQGIQGEQGSVGPQGEVGPEGPQGLPGRDGVNGADGKDGITPSISIGTVTTLEAGENATVEIVGTSEKLILNFGIPKGQDGEGSGDASIDDTTIRKDATWSSSKIEDFVLTNDDVVRTEVNGENLSIDYTKEGYLREVEIWGNTVQNEEDLSDIQHLGELYVDDEGEPVLDSQGREQYKVEIESCNDINAMDNCTIKEDYRFNGENEDGSPKEQVWKGMCIVTVPIFKNKTYVLNKVTKVTSVQLFNKKGLFVRKQSSPYGDQKFTVDFDGYAKFSIWITEIENIYFGTDLSYYNANKLPVPTQSHKTTILLPCQLMKVGDVYDRLYWDSEKGKYVVEKNTLKDKIDETWNIAEGQAFNYNGYRTFTITSKLDISTDINKVCIISDKLKEQVRGNKDIQPTFDFITNTSNAGKIAIAIAGERLTSQDIEGFKTWLIDNNIVIYYIVNTPQLMETNITEQILLPTYKDKTHIFVAGGIDGSIKAKAPLDGGQAILSLSQENKELQEVNQQQDELINISLLATDEVFSLLEPLLASMISESSNISPLINMYVAMCQRGLKDRNEVPIKYREQVAELLRQLED